MPDKYIIKSAVNHENIFRQLKDNRWAMPTVQINTSSPAAQTS